ncbi:WGR domain-containing protein [Caballeronia sp.]|uniref:WGR domain-containing protein n=1 Tax=Caballeronia sp. TaxID=1931223 RepID=UPI003C700311
MSCLSWLHPLKSWSLRQTRRGSIRRWGRIGCRGRKRLQFFRSEDASRAQVNLETWLTRKRKRGYAPRSAQARPALLCHDSASSLSD